MFAFVGSSESPTWCEWAAAIAMATVPVARLASDACSVAGRTNTHSPQLPAPLCGPKEAEIPARVLGCALWDSDPRPPGHGHHRRKQARVLSVAHRRDSSQDREIRQGCYHGQAVKAGKASAREDVAGEEAN